MESVPVVGAQAPTSPHTAFDRQSSLLNCHLFEYNALTTRITYWVSLQYATYTIAAAFLGFVAQGWGTVSRSVLAWACALVLELLAWAMLQTTWEICSTVAYIEKELKPRVQDLIKDKDLKPPMQALIKDELLWAFEPYIWRLRSRGYLRYETKYGLAGIFVGALTALAWLLVSLNRHTLLVLQNLPWLAGCVYLAVMITGKAYKTFQLQKDIEGITSARHAEHRQNTLPVFGNTKGPTDPSAQTGSP